MTLRLAGPAIFLANLKVVSILFLGGTLCAQSWIPQTSNTRASLRGVSAVDAKTVWASGSGGTYLTTADGGAHWRASKVPGAESLDFRASARSTPARLT